MKSSLDETAPTNQSKNALKLQWWRRDLPLLSSCLENVEDAALGLFGNLSLERLESFNGSQRFLLLAQLVIAGLVVRILVCRMFGPAETFMFGDSLALMNKTISAVSGQPMTTGSTIKPVPPYY